MKCQLLCAEAKLPKRATDGAAGYDLFSVEETVIGARDTLLVKTGVSIVLPPGTCGQIWPRSGLSKKGLHTGAGLIDSDYRGEIMVVLHNLSDKIIMIDMGMRIAQLVIVKIDTPPVAEAVIEDEHKHDGFGSTGVKDLKK